MTAVLVLLGLVAFGVFTGTMSGLLGIGGGIFIVPFLVLVAGFSQHAAQAASLFVVLPTAIVGTVALQRKGVGDLGASTQLGLAGIVFGVAGAALAVALPGDVLRVIFGVFLGLIAIRLLVEARRSREAAS
jgi:uncharacterized protein